MPNNGDRLGKVRIIGEDNCRLKIVLVGTYEEIGSKIDIRPFLFRLNHERRGSSVRRWVDEVHPDITLEKLTVMHVEIGEGQKRTNKRLLSNVLVWIVWARLNQGSEVPNAVDLIMTGKRQAT